MNAITLDSFRDIANVTLRADEDRIVDIKRHLGRTSLVMRDIKDAKKAAGNETVVRSIFYNSIVSSLMKSGKELDEGLLDWLRGKLGLASGRHAPAPKPLMMRTIKECLERVDAQTTQELYNERMTLQDGEVRRGSFSDDFVAVSHGTDTVFDNHLHKEFKEVLDELNAGENVRATRQRFFTALKAQFPTVAPETYEKLDVKGLAQLAAALVERPNIKPDDLAGFLEGLRRDSQSVNTNELLDAIDRVRTDSVYASKVSFRKTKPVETGVKAMLADLAFDQDAALLDNSATAERRILTTLKRHVNTLAILCANPKSTLLASQIPVAALPLLGKVVDLAKEVFGLQLEQERQEQSGGGFFASLFSGAKRLLSGKSDSQQYIEQLNSRLSEAEEQLKRGERPEALTRFNAGVDAIVGGQCEKFQAVMTKAFDSMISKKALSPSDFIYDFGGEEIARATEEIFGQGMELPPRPEDQERNAFEIRPEARKPFATEDQVRRFGLRNERDGLVAELNNGYAGLPFDEKVKRLATAFEGFIGTTNPGRLAKSECREDFFRWIDAIKAGQAQMPAALDDNMQLFFYTEMPKIDPQFEKRLLKSDPPDNGAFHELPAVEVEAMGEQEREAYELRRIGAQSLDDLAGSGALDPASGYGKYVKNLMTRYFREADPMDRRAMFASMIMNAPSASDLFKVGGDGRPGAAPEDLASQTLGAFLKGAGPVMQKTLQQLSSLDVPKVFKDALADMRSNLRPLSDQIIHAMLADLVANSNGEIAHLEVVDSLGAASVAQTIHCRLTDSKGETRDVVVKLIRPEAENRAKREAKLCLQVAGEIEGMTASIQGRLDRIMEEFDLTIEQRNAEAGAVYDGSGTLHDRAADHIFRTDHTEKFNDVHSVKIDKLSPGTRSAMIMQLAPGKTIDRLLVQVEKEMAALDEQYMTAGHVRGETAEERRRNYLEYQGKLAELQDRVRGVQRKTVHFAHSWVSVGVYGIGFFHGDAHAGNVTVDTNPVQKDNKGLTVIDFGNATQLTKRQQDAVLQVIASCMLQNAGSYMESFRSLLSEGGKADFDRLRGKVLARVELILGKGGMAQTGKVISATLSELQKLGIEIPAPVFNFSQCQLLIQGTVEQLNRTLKGIRVKMGRVTESMAGDFRNVAVENIRRRAEAYSLEDDDMLDAAVREFLQAAPTPRLFERFEAEAGAAAEHDPELKKAYTKLVGDPAYVARRNRFADERLVRLYERADAYDYEHMDDVIEDPQYFEKRLAELREREAIYRGTGLELVNPNADGLKEIEIIEMVLRQKNEREQVRAEYHAAQERLELPLDDVRFDSVRAEFKTYLTATRQKFYQNFQNIIDRQVEKTAPGQADRDFLAVMVNALFDNKLKTAWSLGPGKSVRMLWAMLTA